MLENKELFTFIVGILTSIIAFYINSRLTEFRQTKKLACAFSAEITALLNQYNKIGGPLLQKNPDGSFRVFTTNIDDDFFTIYNKNADKIGYFNNKLTLELVTLYTNAKGFVCSIKTWNNLVAEKPIRPEEIMRYHEYLVHHHDEIFVSAKQVLEKLNEIKKTS